MSGGDMVCRLVQPVLNGYENPLVDQYASRKLGDLDNLCNASI